MITTRSRNRPRAAIVGILLLALVPLAGCEQKLDPRQYGQIITALPEIKGADKPFPLPQLEDPAEKPDETPK